MTGLLRRRARSAVADLEWELGLWLNHARLIDERAARRLERRRRIARRLGA